MVGANLGRFVSSRSAHGKLRNNSNLGSFWKSWKDTVVSGFFGSEIDVLRHISPAH